MDISSCLDDARRVLLTGSESRQKGKERCTFAFAARGPAGSTTARQTKAVRRCTILADVPPALFPQRPVCCRGRTICRCGWNGAMVECDLRKACMLLPTRSAGHAAATFRKTQPYADEHTNRELHGRASNAMIQIIHVHFQAEALFGEVSPLGHRAQCTGYR
jgi:hypothetical protein